ncbi:ribonuclease H [Trifolium pratense]|uniref:Ribonuclease H n=1 Tax=Trifolium pratense TaxID=57577 RepID=A0A2K3LLV8_TRIPR|nr:ribonuclease H [Trifolium pratense]
MVFKLDLDKAYDRVNWNFLKDTLVKFKFPPIIISLIMFGITLASNTILWNGSKTDAFTSTRGLRQEIRRHPICLFYVCNVLINKQVRDMRWKPMQMTQNGTKLSHIFFADDILLFAKATATQTRVIDEVLKNFCAMSGLMISHAKSKFCTSSGVVRSKRESIANCSNIQATDRFENYLGFKMFYGRVRKQDFNVVYDRVTAKLASWKSRLLNRPGRGQLPFNNNVVCGSVIWNDVKKAMSRLKDCFKFKIGDGESIAFDVWANDEWNLNAITMFQPRLVMNLPDVWTWDNSTSGVYTVKDAYNWLSNHTPLLDHPNWQSIWRLELPANIQFFTWQAIHMSIST